MKKLLSIFVLFLFVRGAYPQSSGGVLRFAWEGDDVRDVVNAYQYDVICHEFCDFVPLFRPLLGSTSHLIISIYAAETYYGEYVKASEYPIVTYNAYYNIYGCLYKIEQNSNEYRMCYDSNGVLVNNQQYDKNTGRLIKENKHKAPFNVSHSGDDVTVVKNSKGEYWYIYNYKGSFLEDKTIFLEIPYKDGFRADYTLAFRCNKMGERMYVMKDGYAYARSQWLKENVSKNWKKNNTHVLAYYVLKNQDFGCDNRTQGNYGYYYNEVGLNQNKGMSLSQCLSHGVKDNKWYEYTWMNY